MKKIRKKIFEMVKNEYRNIEKEKFIPGKTYNKYDMNQIIDLFKKTLSTRCDIRPSRLYDINIEDNTINLKLKPRLKNINESKFKRVYFPDPDGPTKEYIKPFLNLKLIFFNINVFLLT